MNLELAIGLGAVDADGGADAAYTSMLEKVITP
jgi:hypothetical protein